ncbi:hypothetical protein [Spectribacter hydrogenoxidans]|uniref:Uncharacterized protein n=1 Tax=Spectribacter hydrogenoxidans TaxID=3075608 RepID=A0ABU3C0K5_9GAMM|nr:hypothetical protein [Salinisphaera sp. W335]MDT0635084.1 hypothetical protein [Salinisphaera sp. W335]
MKAYDRDDRPWRKMLIAGSIILEREGLDPIAATMAAERVFIAMSQEQKQALAMKETGIRDREGVEVQVGDKVSLAGNITTDDSMGTLPNGWTFGEDDVYEVYFDDRIGTWSLRLGVEPDTPENRKYMSHAVSLLHDGAVTVIP